jgi:hypothetical protein
MADFKKIRCIEELHGLSSILTKIEKKHSFMKYNVLNDNI